MYESEPLCQAAMTNPSGLGIVYPLGIVDVPDRQFPIPESIHNPMDI